MNTPQSRYKNSFTLTVSSTAAMVSTVFRDDRGRRMAYCSSFDPTPWLCATFAESLMFVFSLFVTVSLMSLPAENRLHSRSF